MSIRRPLIAGNWKMNGMHTDGLNLVDALSQKMSQAGQMNIDLLVCPPFTLISLVADHCKDSGILVGGQDCHMNDKGAHTGDISANMLSDIGCAYVILGHSERRTDHAETNKLVHDKTLAAWTAGLIAIVCVGETETERDQGKTLEVIAQQVSESVPNGATAANTVIAYEPVWAIGTGRTATPDEAQEVHAFIRQQLSKQIGSESDGVRVLYGGSMKPGNAEELLALKDVDGGLIGGAALNADDFWAIANHA